MATLFPRPTNVLGPVFNQSSGIDAPYAVRETGINRTGKYNSKKIDLSDYETGLVTKNGHVFLLTFSSDHIFIPANSKVAYRLNAQGGGSSTGSRVTEWAGAILSEDGQKTKFAHLTYKNSAGSIRNSRKGVTMAPLPASKLAVFKQKIDAGTLPVLDLPEARKIAHAFKTANGEYVILSGDSNDYLSTSARLFFGKAGNIAETKIQGFDTYRDGGTFIVRTKQGTLHVPAPRQRETGAACNWNNAVLTEVPAEEALKLLTPVNAARAQGIARYKTPKP